MARLTHKTGSGGKGNLAMFIERDSKICAAGKPTEQPDQSVKANLNHYSLQDNVNALISDSIKPSITNIKLPPIHKEKKRDMRHAGIFSEGSELINPQVKTKVQTLVEDFKNTSYTSYWKKEVGKRTDPIPYLPEGFNIYTICGNKKQRCDTLYDVIMPANPITDKIQESRIPGYQKTRNYCSFNKNRTFGGKTESDPSGKCMRCCLTDQKIYLGTAHKQPITERHAIYQEATVSKLALARKPNNNASCVPEGFTFGVLTSPDSIDECLITCKKNPFKDLVKKCLSHLNTVRKCLSKRLDGSFFYQFHLILKHLDKTNNNWLPKQVIYQQCKIKYIYLQPSLIEPLLTIWNAFEVTNNEIEYKTFINVINFREPLPDLPKIKDVPDECLDFQTTYGDMVNTNQTKTVCNMAGLASGRYFDRNYPITPEGCCKADRTYLPHESDSKACLSPSVFTLLGVSHRDMYARRNPQTIREVFERAGYKIDPDAFKIIWDNAEKHHSQKWVCYETFCKCLKEYEKSHKI